MSYESELRADADRYSAMCEAGDELAAAEAQVRDEIERAFVLLTKHPAKSLAVPYTKMRSNLFQVETACSVAEAITDTVEGGEVNDELIAALELSACPHVAALRKAIGASWAKRNAADVAACRVES